MAAQTQVFSTSGRRERKSISSPKSSVVNAFLAGAFSGTCSTILFQPLDLVKTQLQTTASGNALKTAGMFNTFSSVVRRNQLKGLWRGLVPSLSRTVPGVGMYFCSLHWLKKNLSSDEAKAWQSVLLGATARTFSGIATLPLTVVKTRYESGQFQYRSVLQALSSIWKTEGSKGLYSGLAATILRDAPFSGLYLMFFTETKKLVRAGLGAEQLNPCQTFMCGVLGGSLASVVTQPADVVKTRVQLYPMLYSGNTDAVISIVKSDGVTGMFKGVVPRTLRRTLMAAMAWTVYEEIMRRLCIK